MSNSRHAAKVYWLGSIGQIAIVCACCFALKISKTAYPQILDTIFLIVGGMSSALWGIIVSLKFKLRKSLAEILKDFFNLRKSPWGYLAVIGFIILIYGVQIFRGRVNENVYWYTYFILLLQAIVFGGIEEIGWRKEAGHGLDCATLAIHGIRRFLRSRPAHGAHAQREMAAGASAGDAELVRIHAVFRGVAADESHRAMHVLQNLGNDELGLRAVDNREDNIPAIQIRFETRDPNPAVV